MIVLFVKTWGTDTITPSWKHCILF